MAPRAEPFRLALQVLRERLRDGRFLPGERIRVVMVAEEIHLSPTPVREALARLAGEGLVEDRRGDGYFAWALSAAEIADLYRLNLAHLEVALDPRRPRAGAWDRETPPQADPVSVVERLFFRWVVEAGGRSIAASYQSVMLKLGPARRKEPLLFSDLGEEAANLTALDAGADPARRRRQLGVFHARRVAAADRIARLLEPGAKMDEV
jgi:hypothetical protein